MKILIFTEGTFLMHGSAHGIPREERVEQVIHKESSVDDYKTYIPISNALSKIHNWIANGAVVYYLTSRRGDEVDVIRKVLLKHKFPYTGNLSYRIGDEDYKDVAIRIMPDILIEDDCESIGGEKEMTYPQIPESIKSNIKSIVVKEFSGLDLLPSDLEKLLNF